MGVELAHAHAVIGENVDRIVTMDLRPRGFSHGVIHKLYAAARATSEPLTLAAARALRDAVTPGSTVFIATRAGNALYLPKGETDGPLGAAALAKIVAEGLHATPILLTEAAYIEPLAAAVVAAGLGIRDPDVALQVAGTTAVLAFPETVDEADQRSDELLANFNPRAIVSIEKLGPNAAGVIHSATGMAMGDDQARIDRLVERARAQGIVTIGVGDNGNEIGFGRIQTAVWEHKQFGQVCRCPCGQGLATSVATDVLVVAGTSNWGAYGIEACLAALLERPDLIHTPEIEAFMLVECVRAGGVDGSLGRQILGVDGTSASVQTAMIELLRATVSQGLGQWRERPF